MSENVVEIDFGKDYNDAARRLAWLMGLVEEHQRAIIADPVKFLPAAHDQMAQLLCEMRSATEALCRPIPMATTGDVPLVRSNPTVFIDRREYEALKRCEAIVIGWRDRWQL